MSEKQSSPEQQPKPLYDNCGNCEQDYELTSENSIVQLYSKQTECSFLFCICPNCSYKTRIYINPYTVTRAQELGIEVVDSEPYAPQPIYDEWCEVKGIELPKTYELTNRHEQIIGKFATALASTPDEHLYDLITDTGYNQPYPLRWT